MPSISKEEIIPMLQMQMPVLEGPILWGQDYPYIKNYEN